MIGPSGSGKSTLCRAINRLEPINSRHDPLRRRAAAGGGQGAGPAAQRRRHGVPVVQPVRAQDRAGERHARPDQGAQGSQHGRSPRSGRWRCSTGSASPTRRTSTRRSSPAASSSGPRSPGRWRCSQGDALRRADRALDPEMVNEVLDVMTALARDGMTMIVVTHEMGFARHAANRVVFMADGQIVEEADAGRVLHHPRRRPGQGLPVARS